MASLSSNRFHSVEDRDGIVQSGMEHGLIEFNDLLAELLAKLAPEKK